MTPFNLPFDLQNGVNWHCSTSFIWRSNPLKPFNLHNSINWHQSTSHWISIMVSNLHRLKSFILKIHSRSYVIASILIENSTNFWLINPLMVDYNWNCDLNRYHCLINRVWFESGSNLMTMLESRFDLDSVIQFVSPNRQRLLWLNAISIVMVIQILVFQGLKLSGGSSRRDLNFRFWCRSKMG